MNVTPIRAMNQKVISGAVIFLVGVAINIYNNSHSFERGSYHISLFGIVFGLIIMISALADEKRSKEKKELMERASLGQVTREDWLARGAESFHLHEYDDALKSFDMALKMDPNYADAWINKGSALHELGMYRDAIAAYDQATRIEPQNANAWKRMGYALKKLDRNSEAKEAFSRAEELGN